MTATPVTTGTGGISLRRLVLATPLFRSAVITLLISGIAVSSSSPQLTLFFVTELHAPLPLAGLYYLTNLAAPVAGFLLGRASDRARDRLTLFRVCGVVGAAGWTAMALSTRPWMPFVISVLALSIAGAGGAQIFAAVRDELTRNPTGADNRVIATIRMAFTLGWIIGPVLGGWIGGLIGLRPLLLGCAALTLVQLLPLLRHHVPRLVVAGPDDDHPHPVGSWRAMAPMLIFVGTCVLALSGDALKIGYLPIYLDEVLHAPDAVRGAVIATQPLVELCLIPVAGIVADRFGAQKVVTVGVALGLVANLCYGFSDSVATLFVAQVLMAGMWGCLAGLGVSVAQSLYPQGVGVASSVFYSGLSLGVAVGGTVGGLGVGALGMPNVFFLPAGLAAIGLVGMIIQVVRSGGLVGR